MFRHSTDISTAGGKARQGKVRKLGKERNEAERGKYQKTVEQIGRKQNTIETDRREYRYGFEFFVVNQATRLVV